MITGNGSLSLRKKDLENQKTPTVGFRKTVFAHKAAAGETGFNLASLTTPTELTANGFSQPSVGELQNANLLFYRNNLKVISSARGVLVDYLSYSLGSSTQINFLGFTALEGEIFYGIIDYSAQTGLKVVDASAIIATGTLSATQTDFNVGTPFKTGQYPSFNVGGVLVYKDRVLQQRNTSNSSTVLDKDYYEVDAGAGLGSIIRFNEADPDEDAEITVVSNGLLSERPDGSMMAVIESLSGYLDNIVEVVAQLAGLSEATVKGAAPSNVDLKNFGDKVYALEQNRARIDLSNSWTAYQPLPGKSDGAGTASGIIGESIVQSRLRSASTALTTTVGKNITASPLVLGPGLYEITGSIGMTPGTTSTLTFGASYFAYSNTTNTVPGSGDIYAGFDTTGQAAIQLGHFATTAGSAQDHVVVMPSIPLLVVSGTVTLYLVAQVTFTNTLNAYGYIRARRVG